MALSFVSNGQREKPKYTFKMDEVAAEFEAELTKKKVDTIMQAYYLYDNGRGDKATNLYFWTKNGKHQVKAIGFGKKNKAKDFEAKACPEFEKILDFYFQNIEAIFQSVPEQTPGATLSLVHNYGFLIKLKMNQTEFKTFLRDERRIKNTHPRAEWINMIAEVAEPYIAGK
ncbi:hypothetical protein PXD56_15620 [Maribacter sp. SA7]|uniref:hypothetical protein n=1 Tax=Maribacter zhoushanensis TaxID=3030012 RepID=UPI0023ED095D|nr:hypothetical protein [Maribacter zhoushanensis]MDF4204403.1 hypothetical protein [Maribacter zhoushanensis]